MEPGTEQDFALLTDEKFDFDLSLSPSSGKEDGGDDEVFIGPIGHKEKCVAVCVEIQKNLTEEQCPPKLNDQVRWSPLSGDKFVEIFKEAHLLARQLESSKKNELNKENQSEGVRNAAIEKFVQESKSKLKIFQNAQECVQTPIAIKRETYCVQDSPFSQLPPSIQQRLQLPVEKMCLSPTHYKSPPQKAQTTPKCVSVLPVEQKQKTNEPHSAKRPTAIVEKKNTVGKLQPMKSVPSKINRLGLQKPKPKLKLSPSQAKHLSSAGSSEDVHSDKSSVASDINDSSFSNCTLLQTKRAIPAPSQFGLRKPQLKPPAAVLPLREKNASSSSSSSHSSMNCSLNSSLSVSPQGGNAPFLNNSVSNSRLPCNTGRLSMLKPNSRLSSAVQPSFSDGAKKLMKPNCAGKHPVAKMNKSASISMTQAPTPVNKMQRQISDPNLQKMPLQNKPPSAVEGNACTRPEGIEPTPITQLKGSKVSGASFGNKVPKIMQPKRLLACSGTGRGVTASTPVKASAVGTLQNSSFSARSASVTSSAKRLSALPTPLGRRFSGIPTATPTTMPRAFSSPHLTDGPVSSKWKRALVDCLEQSKVIKSQRSSHPKSSSSEGDATSPDLLPVALDFSPEKTETKIVEQTEIQQSNEVLLIDIGIDETPVIILGPESKPLIDLSNTPEMVKRRVPFKSVEQLIDLSSPLIKMSPRKEKQEFFSPLLKF